MAFEFDSETLVPVFRYLDDLRRSGRTNMYGAGAYLQEVFGFTRKEASLALMSWMQTFSDADVTRRVAQALEFEESTKNEIEKVIENAVKPSRKRS